MLSNNIKHQSKRTNPKIKDLTPNPVELKINEMLNDLSVTFPQFLKKELSHSFSYKGVRFEFGDMLNIFGKEYIVLALLREEKKLKVILINDFLKYSDCSFKATDEGIWVSLEKYLQYDDLRNLKISVIK